MGWHFLETERGVDISFTSTVEDEAPNMGITLAKGGSFHEGPKDENQQLKFLYWKGVDSLDGTYKLNRPHEHGGRLFVENRFNNLMLDLPTDLASKLWALMLERVGKS